MQPAGTIRVTVDAFSGRPNPNWSLTPPEAAELITRVSSLSERAPTGAQPLDGLGFRGFIVTRMARVGVEAPWLAVRRGVVQVAGAHGTIAYADTAGIEEWLRAAASARGFGDIVGEPRTERKGERDGE